jgi:tRNA(Ile)-lysidine synthase
MNLEFHRPLLGVWRIEIEEYIRHHGLKFCEDDSNRDLAYTRNRVRHEILPMLSKAFGRDVSRALWKAAEVSRADQEWMDAMLAPLLIETETLGVAEIRKLPTAVQRRVILHWLRANSVPNIDFDDVENVRSLLDGSSPAKVNLSAGMHARRRSGVIFLEHTE